jgi:hypothetical protein
MLGAPVWARKKKTPVAAGVFRCFATHPKRGRGTTGTLRASHRWVAAVQSAGDWRLPWTRFLFFIRATAGAASAYSPSAAVVTVVIATVRAAAARRLGRSSARPPKAAIRRLLTGARTMLATNASTGRVGEKVP